jgi:general secretion pathway protein C
MKRLPVMVMFVLFIALCVSLAYWGMQLFKPPVRPVAAPVQASTADVRLDVAAGLFGGRKTAVAAATNYQLKGVILAGRPEESVAILSVEGKPAQALGVDKEVVPGVSVKEVHAQYVLLSDGGVSKRVDLPENAPPSVRANPPANGSTPTQSRPSGMAQQPTAARQTVQPTQVVRGNQQRNAAAQTSTQPSQNVLTAPAVSTTNGQTSNAQNAAGQAAAAPGSPAAPAQSMPALSTPPQVEPNNEAPTTVVNNPRWQHQH